ncbi:hypothetical protein B0H10DRAFT_1947012 [Mycena sp. CBHHK59/15]|nr:hypothetical protein B0H10DRAFT_1947012 [Mycena sp. CBHHK59/15]
MHGDGTDLSQYFWPRYALPVLSNGCQSAADALTSAGMRLIGLVYDARKTIMDLGSVFVEHHGFEIGYAIEFLSHILSWNTFDNNFRLHWRTRDDFVENYEDSHVPDPIYDYPAWCSYCVEWLHEMTRKGSKNVTILEALSAPGRQPFRGLGRYGTNEVLSIAGWTLLYIVLQEKVMFAVLCEAFFQFVSSRGLKVEEYYRKASNASAKIDEDDNVDVDFSMNASLDQQLRRTHVGANEADLIDSYNEASLKTWDEEFLSWSQSARENLFNPRTTDMSKVFLPFDLTNMLSSATKFGHLGQLIAGDYWEGILLELVQHPQKLKQLEDDRNAKKRAETEHDPLYTVQSEKTRDESTIAHIKNKTKGWTVGPHDFVGHGHIIKHGSSSSLLLATRFICYSDAEDAVHLGCSQSLSRWYAKVEQRSAGTRESLEKQDSAISKEMGKPVAAVARDYFTKEIIQRHKKERIRTMGPKDTARVKNRSRIPSLGKKWAELDEMVEF